MEEHWLWYLTGSVDSLSTMTVRIQKDDSRSLGYNISPKIYISRKKDVEALFGMIDEYAEDIGVSYRIYENNNSNRLVIEGADNIRHFIEPILEGFIQQRDRADFFLDEVLPKLERGVQDSKLEFIEAMKVVDELAQYPIQPHSSSKYDADYFRDEWDLP